MKIPLIDEQWGKATEYTKAIEALIESKRQVIGSFTNTLLSIIRRKKDTFDSQKAELVCNLLMRERTYK